MKHLLIQFHTDSLTPVSDDNLKRYYDRIWSAEYYHKPDAFWELPKWAGELTYAMAINKVYPEFKVLKKVDYIKADIAYASVLNVNKEKLRLLAVVNPDVQFIFGGYIDGKEYFKDVKNVQWVTSIEHACKLLGWHYRYGTDWSLFQGTKCIPRITMSSGCKHRCKFCTIPNKVMPVDEVDIKEQIFALMPLKFNLIYLDDKTFGQCSNYRDIAKYERMVKMFNPEFKGFVVQTTASMVKKIDWSKLPVYAAEVGVESFNDSILKHMRKPATEKLIEDAGRILNEASVKYIPNIIIGFQQETGDTYMNTIRYIMRTNILHANVYNLAVYDDADIKKEIECSSEEDSNEMEIDKTYNSELKNSIDRSAFDLFIEVLNRK